MDKSNIYNEFGSDISFFIKGRTSSDFLGKERNITTKPVVSVWFIHFSTYFYHFVIYIYIYMHAREGTKKFFAQLRTKWSREGFLNTQSTYYFSLIHDRTIFVTNDFLKPGSLSLIPDSISPLRRGKNYFNISRSKGEKSKYIQFYMH